jgi:alpha-ribazole phosphatase
VQVFLIRHPRPAIAPGVCYGQLDIDCVDVDSVADSLHRRLPAGIPVISSPLRRARRLAEALSEHVRIDARLSEIHFGAWEGQRWDTIERGQLDAWAKDILGFVPPGGESVAALYARAQAFAASLDPNLPHVAVVTHAGVMRALLGHWRCLPLTEWSQLQFAYGELVQVQLPPEAASP